MYQFKELYTLDFSKDEVFSHFTTYTNRQNLLEFHNVIGEELDFPDYYGCNWDALWDCMTDMIGEPIHIEIIGLDVVEKMFGKEHVEKFLEILKRIKHYDHDRYSHEIQIEIVNGDERISLE